jgi:hypothetical protein
MNLLNICFGNFNLKYKNLKFYKIKMTFLIENTKIPLTYHYNLINEILTHLNKL